MPYEITTTRAVVTVGRDGRSQPIKRYRDEMDRDESVRATVTEKATITRRAVATLDEAQRWVNNRREQDALNARPWPADLDSVIPWPSERYTIGPLPDGTVIKVAPIHRETLAAEGGYPRAAFVSTSDLIDAYNAAQS